MYKLFFAGTVPLLAADTSITFFAFLLIVLIVFLLGYIILSYQKKTPKKRKTSTTENHNTTISGQALNTKPHGGTLDIEILPFRLSGMLHILTNRLSDSLQEYRHTLYYDIDRNVERYISGDNDYLEQVLEILAKELIVKNTDAEIIIDIVRNREKSISFTISNSAFKDNKKELSRYKQILEEEQETGEATNNELHHVREIVDAIGGELSVKKNRLGNIEFLLDIPYYPDKKSRSNQNRLKSLLSGEKVLFVGKKKSETKRIEYIFKTYGIKIEYMPSETFEHKKPDLHKYRMAIFHSSDLNAKHIASLKKRTHEKSKDLKIIIIHELFEEETKIERAKQIADAEIYNPTIIGDVEEILYQLFILQSKAVKGVNNLEIFDPKSFTIHGNRGIDAKTLERYRGAHIVVAEDSKVDQRVMRNILSIDGIKITLLNNGESVLEILKQEPVDMIFTDINMPVMDGLKMTKKIRENTKWQYLPIISISSMAFSHEVKAMQTAGINAAITKPISAQDVYAAIEQFLIMTPEIQQRNRKTKLTNDQQVSASSYIPDIKVLDVQAGVTAYANETTYRAVLSETMFILRHSAETFDKLIEEEKYHALSDFAKSTLQLCEKIHAPEMIDMFKELLVYLSQTNKTFATEYRIIYRKNWQRLEQEAELYLAKQFSR